MLVAETKILKFPEDNYPNLQIRNIIEVLTQNYRNCHKLHCSFMQNFPFAPALKHWNHTKI